jgi:3-oxoacyl-[acyl-carrier-protein] synthase II
VSDRLLITGLGLVTPLGTGVDATWTALVRGDRAIRPITLFDTSGQRVAIAGEVACVARSGVVGEPGGWSRTNAMAASAAGEAMRMAMLDARAHRVGLVVGGTTGGMFETEQLLARLHAEPDCRETLASMLAHPLTATGDYIEQALGPFARIRTLSSACSSGANAIVVAASWLLAGEVDAVVAGGSDGLCRLTLSGFNALAALDPEPCRPFDRRRRGTSLGEGAGFLILERENRAVARGVPPIAALAGWAVGSEAHHITNPAPDGALVASLIETALGRAGVGPAQVDYVNAHGTGTPSNDAMEAVALARAFGAERSRIPVSSSKGQLGHTLGAAGAVEAAITALVVSRRVLVPTAGLDDPDPALGLEHVRRVGREVPRVRCAVSNAFGFGGMDTVLVLTEPEFPAEAEAPLARASSRRGHGHVAPEADVVVVTGVAIFGPCGRLGVDECARLPSMRLAPEMLVDADAHLDPLRSRRLDRASRLAAVAVEHALRQSRAPTEGTGVLLASAFGNVDASAAYMHRIFERGARYAAPAEFPNLVPSAAVGHVSIYGHLRGPAFATADLATSGESAFAQASQLVSSGMASCIVAGATEPHADIVERVLGALFAHAASQLQAKRPDMAAALVVERDGPVRARHGRVLARVRQIVEWRGDALQAVDSLPTPQSGRAEVLLPRANGGAAQLLDATPWGGCPRVVCASFLGESDALGACAIAIAAARLAARTIDQALIVGLARGRGYAIVLGAD